MRRILLTGLLISSLFMTSCSKDDDETTISNLDVSVTEITTLSAMIKWNVIPNASYYDVYLNINDEGYDIQSSIDASSALEYEAKYLYAGTDYKVKVVAIEGLFDKISEETYEFNTQECNADFIGSWVQSFLDVDYVYDFYNDGIGNHYYDNKLQFNFYWFVKEDGLHIIQYGKQNGLNEIYTIDYAFNSDKQILTINGKNLFKE